MECTSHHFEGGRDAAQDAAEREREIRAERQPGELQMRDAAQDAAERTVVSVLIIIFLHVLAGAAVVRSLQSSRTDLR